jgi:CDGSH-type Zn-finger protein
MVRGGGWAQFLQVIRDLRILTLRSMPTRSSGSAPGGGPQPVALPAGQHLLCSCGRSRHGWFCDGAHLGTGRIPRDLGLQQPTTVLMCGCGRSRRYPLCDGRHDQPAARPWWRVWG